jgi:hypothetical protein
VIPIGVGICLVTPFVVYVIRKKLKRYLHIINGTYNVVINVALPLPGRTMRSSHPQLKDAR